MPTSLLAQWPHLYGLLREFGGPLGRVLDVGPGTGKAPILLRDARFDFDRMDALEAHQGYIDDWGLPAIYGAAGKGGKVWQGRFEDQTVEWLNDFDTILMIDVIEHMEKTAAFDRVAAFRGQVLICTPVDFAEAWAPGMPDSEHHVSVWDPLDFDELDRTKYYVQRNAGWLILLGPRNPSPRGAQ